MRQSQSHSPPSHISSYYAATAVGLKHYPQLAETTSCDVCVIGGGYTGLSTALSLSELGYDTVLLEAKRIGWGASGRNGGQLGSGFNWSQSALEAEFGNETARLLWQVAESAKQEVISRITDCAIPCDFKSGILSAAVTRKAASTYRTDVAHLQERYSHHAVRYVDQDEVQALLGTAIYHGGMLDTSGGHLHPLNLAIGLAGAASDSGARLYESTPFISYRSSREGIVVETQGGETVRTKSLVLACNAYIGRAVARVHRYIMPIDSFIAVTEPLRDDEAQAVIPSDIAVHDSKFCLDYYRMTADRRLLFGGGEAYIPNQQVNITGVMRRRIAAVFPQLKARQIDYAWRGKIAITLSRLPSVGRLGGDVYYAQGYSGHGLALANRVGKSIAQAINGSPEEFDLLASIPHKPFPGGRTLRWPIHVCGMYYYALADRLRRQYAHSLNVQRGSEQTKLRLRGAVSRVIDLMMTVFSPTLGGKRPTEVSGCTMTSILMFGLQYEP